MKFIYRLVFVILFISALTSCTVEKQTAKTFVENRNKISVLILKPDYIYKENKKTADVEDYEKLSEEERESKLLKASKFLQFVNDSSFIQDYSQSLIDELENYNLNVFTANNIDSFLMIDTLAYVFKISQMELDEYIYTSRESDYFDYERYYQDFDLNAVGLYVWMDFSIQNDNINSPVTLFANNFVSDKIDGRFKKRYLYDDVVYVYTRKNMLLSRVNKFSKNAGKKHASYIFDYLLNHVIKAKNPNYKDLELLHFDRKREKLQYVPEGSFIIIDD
ncbi:hypothetical protein ACFLQ5_02745 [Bacteroidota bacterium]